MPIHTAPFSELDPSTLHDMLWLRSEVVIVEQHFPYDIDGRDTEPTAIHCWTEEGGGVLAYLRVLGEEDGTVSIGRVMTRVAARGRGLATELLRHAVHLTDRPIVIHAQVRLERWYAALGFRTVSEMFLEHGMPHYAMRREPAETR